jgi:hypothetical protein
MPIRLNIDAFEHAKELIRERRTVFDEQDAWTSHRPTAEAEDEFIRRHGIEEYAKWHLGIDDGDREDSKLRYKFPYGDFENLHHCGLIAIENRAQESQYYDIGVAASDLHVMLDRGEM